MAFNGPMAADGVALSRCIGNRTRNRRQQALQQHLVQRIGDLAAPARVFEILEMLKPLNNLIVGPGSLRLSVSHGGRQSGSKGLQRFSILSDRHLSIHANALTGPARVLDLTCERPYGVRKSTSTGGSPHGGKRDVRSRRCGRVA
jgi:hypothetical protein